MPLLRAPRTLPRVLAPAEVDALLGALLTGLFARSAINPIFGAGKATGLFEGNWHQPVNQLVGVAIAWTVSLAGTLIILFIVDKTIGLRVSEADENTGLDLSQHGVTSGRIDEIGARVGSGPEGLWRFQLSGAYYARALQKAYVRGTRNAKD